MKSLKLQFESLLDDDDIFLGSGNDKNLVKEWIKNNYRIYGDLTISDDLVVNCSDNVDVKNENIESLTNGIFRWGMIDGGFNCNYCKNLKTLEGAPKIVGESFYCDRCVNLKSLEGAPEKVGRSFGCCGCSGLTTLKGAPKKTDNGFYCNSCINLTSLEGAPKEVGWSFDCDNCPNLKITDSDRGRYGINHMNI